MQTANDLKTLLSRIDRRSYPLTRTPGEPINFPGMCCLSTTYREIPLPPPPR